MLSSRATIAANLTLIGAWAWVHADSLIWQVCSLGRPDSELNLVLAIGLGMLVLWHTDFPAVAARLARAPDANPLAAPAPR